MDWVTTEPRSMMDIVYEVLKQAIIKGELEPGERIVEKKIADMLQVSRTPLRQAIRRLEAEGLLDRVRSGGVRVAKISEGEIREIYDVRIALEVRIIRAVALRIDGQGMERLREVTDRIREHLADPGEEKDAIIEQIKLGDLFHQTLYEIYGNKTCIKILDGFQTKVNRFAYLAYSQRNRSLASAKEHIELYELARRGQAAEAGRKMEEHILRAWETTLEGLRNMQQ